MTAVARLSGNNEVFKLKEKVMKMK